MRIINLSLDRSLLDGSGAAGQRLAGYADRLESLTVLVPADKDRHEARGKLLLYGIGGPKAWAWLKMYFLAGNLIRRKRPDLISVQDQYFLALLAFLLAKRYRLGWEMQVHGFEKMSGPRRRLFAFLVRRADAVSGHYGPTGRTQLEWRRDRTGPGVYFCRVAGSQATVKLVLAE